MKVIGWVFRVILFLVALGFALSNTEIVELRFFGIDVYWRAPLVIFLLGFFAAGTALGMLGVVPTVFRQRREISRLRRELKNLPRGTPASPAAVSAEMATVGSPADPIR